MEIWMEQLMVFLQNHWQFTIIGCGLLIFLGALCNWRWVCEFDHCFMRFSIFIFNVTIIYFAAKQPEALPKAGFRAAYYFPKVLNKFAKNVRWSCGEGLKML